MKLLKRIMQKSEIIITMDYLYSLSCVRFICDKYNRYVNIYHEFEKCDFTLIKIRYGGKSSLY